jgi:hypothetical protein
MRSGRIGPAHEPGSLLVALAGTAAIACLLVAAAVLTLRVAIRPIHGPWSAARLAPAMGLWYGVAPYHEVGRGPLNDWVYPPMALLAYLPATLAPDPAVATLAGRCLSLLFVLGPPVWLLTRATRGLDLAARLGLIALLSILVARSRALTYVATEVVADAPALAFAIVGLGLIGSTAEKTRLAGATCGILAVWCKQIALGLGLAVVLAGLAGRSLKSWPLWLARVALLAAAILALFALAFGPRAMFFQMVTLPSGHPLRVRSWLAVPGALRPVVADHGPHLTIAIVGLVAWMLVRRRIPERVATILPPSPSPALLIAAGLLASPLAGVSYLKTGGDDNSLAHVLLPITIGGILGLVSLLRARTRAGVVGLMALNLVLAWPLVGWIEATWLRAAPSWSDELLPGRSWFEESRRVWTTLRDRPDTLYFPLYPLEHLMASRRPVHFEEGLYDLGLAGIPITTDHLRAFLPPELEALVYPGGRTFTSFEARHRLDFSDQPEIDPDEPGWAVFRPRPRPVERNRSSDALPAADRR